MSKPRVICSIICLTILLSGCGNTAIHAVPPPIPDSFSCAVRITAADETIEADWVMTHGDSVFMLRAPETLAGFTVNLEGDQAQIAYEGVTAVLSQTSCFLALRDAYRSLLNSVCEAVQTPQGWVYDDRDAHGFAVLQDAQNGLPLRISIPSQSITLQTVTERMSAA